MTCNEIQKLHSIISLQEFVEGLNTEECHKLIIEAYGCNGGLQMAKAFLHSGNPVPQPQRQNLPWCICAMWKV